MSFGPLRLSSFYLPHLIAWFGFGAAPYFFALGHLVTKQHSRSRQPARTIDILRHLRFILAASIYINSHRFASTTIRTGIDVLSIVTVSRSFKRGRIRRTAVTILVSIVVLLSSSSSSRLRFTVIRNCSYNHLAGWYPPR